MIKSEVLIEQAIGEIAQWDIDKVEFKEVELYIYLGLERGVSFDGKQAHDFHD